MADRKPGAPTQRQRPESGRRRLRSLKESSVEQREAQPEENATEKQDHDQEAGQVEVGRTRWPRLRGGQQSQLTQSPGEAHIEAEFAK